MDILSLLAGALPTLSPCHRRTRIRSAACAAWLIPALFKKTCQVMLRVPCQTGFCWLLSAVFAAANGLPMAVRHEHELQGGLDHHHSASAAAGNRHSHEHSHGASHSHRADAAATAASASRDENPVAARGELLAVVSHRHVFWFGFEFTFLATSDDGASPDAAAPTTSPDAFGSLSRLLDGNLFSAERTSVAAPLAALAVQPAPFAATSSAHLTTRAQQPLVSAPLCDAARHERSGVQLA